MSSSDDGLGWIALPALVSTLFGGAAAIRPAQLVLRFGARAGLVLFALLPLIAVNYG